MAQPAFYFCICPDARLIQEHLETFLPTLSEAASRERFVYWGDGELPPRFWEQLLLQGLFDTRRTLVLRHAHQLPAAVWKRLSSALSTPNPQCLSILCLEGPWEKGKPKLPAHITRLACLKFAEKQQWIWRQGGLEGAGLRKHIQQRAARLGLRFDPGALEAFCSAVPPNASAVDNELQKLRLAADTGIITPAMCTDTGYLPDFNIFSFIRRIQAGRLAEAWGELRRGQRDGDSLLFPFLGLLLREARLLWQIRSGESVRLHPSDAAAKQALAQRLGHDGISRLFVLATEAEYAVKSGQRQPNQTLEALVADLIHLFRV